MSDPRTEIVLSNEYGCDFPIWDDEGCLMDVEDLDLSPELVADLAAWAARWEAGAWPSVFDDRWDGVPVMQSLAGWRDRARSLSRSARRREAGAQEQLASDGQALKGRLQDELGAGYVVRLI